MIWTRVEDLEVYLKATELWKAVNAILDRPGFGKDRRLREQLADAIDSMVSNIDEGFEQPTDRAFANYVYISKASTAETRTRLRLAWRRGYITNEELQERLSAANDVGRLATGLIAHLIRSNRKNRGIVRRLGTVRNFVCRAD